MADPTYNKAAITVSDFNPNHRDEDSSNPPINDPNKFDPRALPRKPARAKLEIKMMPAKKTGVHKIRVATTPLSIHDSKNNFCSGTAYINASERNKPAYAIDNGMRGRAP